MVTWYGYAVICIRYLQSGQQDMASSCLAMTEKQDVFMLSQKKNSSGGTVNIPYVDFLLSMADRWREQYTGQDGVAS